MTGELLVRRRVAVADLLNDWSPPEKEAVLAALLEWSGAPVVTIDCGATMSPPMKTGAYALVWIGDSAPPDTGRGREHGD